MTYEYVNEQFKSVYSDITEEDQFYVVKPFLAHYTNLQNIESILRNEEIWLSNPLLMNDREELEFGIINGYDEIVSCKEIHDALQNANRVTKFLDYMEFKLEGFKKNDLLDTYVFSLSEIDKNDIDGTLSMWRAYGSDGNGGAIVFDCSKIDPAEDTPLTIARVHYASNADRMKWIKEKCSDVAKIIQLSNFEDSDLYFVAHFAFERMKLFALYTKNIGFSEEREWRVVYSNSEDVKNLFSSMKSYHNGPKGIEPKLKLNFANASSITGGDDDLISFIDKIILGPARKNALALASFNRMLDVIGKPQLKDKTFSCSIPYRNNK